MSLNISLPGAIEIAKLYRKVPEPIRKVIRPLTGRYRPWLAGRKRISALTPEQLRFWDQQGYLVLEGHFSKERVQAINSYVDALWEKREAMSNSPFVVDIFLGTPNEKRMLLRDAPASARQHNYKLYDLYLESQLIRDAVLDPTLADILWGLMGEEPLVCNTINFEWGSGQEYHFDTWYMPPPETGQLVASWIALEDIVDEAGPLKFVPGSHKIPPFVFPKSGTTIASFDELPLAREYIKKEVEKRGLKEATFTGKPGAVFIWHAQLLHGGKPVENPARSRRSLVTHYWRWCDYLFAPVRSEGPGRRFLNRPHQKV
jgi:hypothetical protein